MPPVRIEGEGCASDLFPQAALNAMVLEASTPRHDDGHTDCYYAGLLLAALPHLITDEMIERAARQLYNNGRLMLDDHHSPEWEDLPDKPSHRYGYPDLRETRELYRADAHDALVAALGQERLS